MRFVEFRDGHYGHTVFVRPDRVETVALGHSGMTRLTLFSGEVLMLDGSPEGTLIALGALVGNDQTQGAFR